MERLTILAYVANKYVRRGDDWFGRLSGSVGRVRSNVALPESVRRLVERWEVDRCDDVDELRTKLAGAYVGLVVALAGKVDGVADSTTISRARQAMGMVVNMRHDAQTQSGPLGAILAIDGITVPTGPLNYNGFFLVTPDGGQKGLHSLLYCLALAQASLDKLGGSRDQTRGKLTAQTTALYLSHARPEGNAGPVVVSVSRLLNVHMTLSTQHV